MKKRIARLKRYAKKFLLKKLVPSQFYFSAQGYCPCCDQEVTFKATNPWLRDNFLCSSCKSIPRERALMLVIERYYPDWKNLSIHESSPAARGASVKLKLAAGYHSSQYFPKDKKGEMIGIHRNEDLEEQTYTDESFDLVITQDVMEHIFHPEKAFKEIARTLKKGGAHIFTVPIINRHKPTEIWATSDVDGNPIFTQEPEYHRNPVDAKGSPVTMHWGFDIVQFIEKHSELKTIVEYIDDMRFGIRAEFIEVLVSRKSK